MDWNKISTILITAFIILNVFLFVSSKDILNAGFGPENDPEFPQEVANLLKVQNITINTEIPGETYVLPVLETEYEIINIDSKLLQNFLNEKIDPIEDVYKYTNSKGESLEIRDGKKLILILRKKVNEKFDRKDIREEISRFLEQKNIDADGYVENLVHISENEAIYRYTLRYNDYPLDNSYMYFFADNQGIYKFEMQRIIAVSEITEKVRTIKAIEALPRILTYPEIKNKEITRIEMTYYSVEDENWHNIERINSDPTWKVIFSDGTQVHLPGID
ncbi:MAG TPA: two-component system regulatory protein YycI [Sedimentibacter sp.]|jgi:regulatory protein YycI of two-component signal transduction system YycFG|nr:two-component system regulatory protein YycI [Sedimentibacter sp.]